MIFSFIMFLLIVGLISGLVMKKLTTVYEKRSGNTEWDDEPIKRLIFTFACVYKLVLLVEILVITIGNIKNVCTLSKRTNKFFVYNRWSRKINQSINICTWIFIAINKPVYRKGFSNQKPFIKNMKRGFVKKLNKLNRNVNIHVYTNQTIIKMFSSIVVFTGVGDEKLSLQCTERLALISYHKFLFGMFSSSERKAIYEYVTESVLVGNYNVTRIV